MDNEKIPMLLPIAMLGAFIIGRASVQEKFRDYPKDRWTVEIFTTDEKGNPEKMNKPLIICQNTFESYKGVCRVGDIK